MFLFWLGVIVFIFVYIASKLLLFGNSVSFFFLSSASSFSRFRRMYSPLCVYYFVCRECWHLRSIHGKENLAVPDSFFVAESARYSTCRNVSATVSTDVQYFFFSLHSLYSNLAVGKTHKQSLVKLVLGIYSVVGIVAKCDKMFPTLRGIVQLFILNICVWSYCGRAVCEGHKDRRVRRRTLHSVNFIHTIVSILTVRQWKGVAISFQTVRLFYLPPDFYLAILFALIHIVVVLQWPHQMETVIPNEPRPTVITSRMPTLSFTFSISINSKCFRL